ncbi:ABC transporter substrate-binding protein [Pseudovibrio sp. Tun.PSC04-5.I4]|uniref:ABC transporter substrate-binding protein n=1 Tax=Pseudovibrio sp. Tun.PSC04-5.I4 TaxID=1798213 RepID=UPI00088FE9B5|nr:ABC transporter substrate-binding protein [Pseudovibrio sp. Tun.PSC04-5.I4]SDQ90915.1 glycine betaine/proline transport system substrate-binding protein [Pseudovibrio sp. Tun.PSC04-5.I4]
MLNYKFAIATLAFALPFGAIEASAADAPACEIDRPVVFAGVDLDSTAFSNSVASFIIKNGYGCETDSIPGSTIPLLNGLARGDIDVFMEAWPVNVGEALAKGEAKGDYVNLGINFDNVTQAWYVPKYLVEGENAPAKGLKSVTDLPKYKDVFSDPEEPGKGRFYNCIAGWGCEIVNTKKLNAYGLLDDYVNFRPGTGAALAATIDSNMRRKRPIVFYYWGPTWVMGKYGDEMVQLEEPAYNKAVWDALDAEDDASLVKEAVAYPLAAAHVYVNSEFQALAPQLVEFLTNYKTTAPVVSKGLAYMLDTDGTTDDAAIEFLKTNPDMWTKWVSADVQERVKAALAQ